jgi:hypothetical protein
VPGGNSCATYSYEAGGTQAAAAGGPVHCPQTFQGKSFAQVTLYDGPPTMGMAMKPRQDAAADRWTLAPRTDNQRYALVCHYSGVPHERWSKTPSSENANLEIELPAAVRECSQQRRADQTSLGLTCQ